MALPDIQKETVKKSLDGFYDRRIPKNIRDQVRLSYEFRGNSATLFEDRPHWQDPKAEWSHAKVAQFRFDTESLNWSVYCRDRNGKWHEYIGLKPTKNFSVIIHELDEDPTGSFWG